MATEAQPAKQAKLLVVEDDVLVRMLLADMLCEIGYTVAAEAASVDEALEATRKTDSGGEHVVIVLAPLAREAAPSGALEN